jgi:methionyl-tRNA formyltransferase
MNFGFLSTLDSLLLPYTIKNAKNLGIKNIFVFIDEKGMSIKDKTIFQKRTKGRFGDDMKSNDYLLALSNLNVPFYFVDNHNSDLSIELYSLLKIDCLINAGTPRKISKKLLNKKIIPQGVLNLHPGKLPEYRGCSAVEWAILNDDQIFNTVHYMEEDYDTGPLIKTEPYQFKSNSTYVDIRSEVYLKGINLLCDMVKKIQNKEFSYNDAQKQNDSKAQHWDPIPENLEHSSIEKANNKMYTFQNLGKDENII